MEKKEETKVANNKIAIIAIAAVAIIAVIAIVLLVMKPKGKGNDTTTTTTTTTTEVVETVTITFDSNGGEPVDPITVKKGEEVTLPSTSREGYIFNGWLDENDDMPNTVTSFNEDKKYTANWAPITEDIKTMTITLDSKGGTKISPITLECTGNSVTINSVPKGPLKTGYTFRAWEDKNGKVILPGAKLTCKNITLYAVYDQEGEQNKAKCPEGFNLNESSKKCTSEKTPEYSCEDGYTNSSKDKTVCYKYLKSPDNITCKDSSKYYFTQGTTTGSVMHFCATEMPSYTGSPEQCGNAGGTLKNNHCVKNIENVSYSKLNVSCYNSVFREGNNLDANAKDGCYDLKQRTYGCKNAGEGYTMNYTTNKCVKTVDAN